MVKKRKRTKKVIAIVAGVLVVVLLGASLAAGNFLFDFALNPAADFTMSDLLMAGEVDGVQFDQEPQEGQNSNSYDDTQLWIDHCEAAALWFEEEGSGVVLQREDGSTRSATRFSNEGHLYAIVCHGYYSNGAQMCGYARMFYDLGMSVLVPDALAHGQSDGDYIGMGWLERADILAWIDSIVAEDPQAQIVLFGVSMGGATVMMAAGEDLPDNVKCVVEDCGYSSVYDEFAVQIGQTFGLPEFPLLYTADLICCLRAGYWFGEASAVEQLKNAELPMLFIHGEEDTFVPYEMLDQVYEACASEVKEKLSIPGAGHGLAAATDPVTYWSTIEKFMGRFMDLEADAE